MDSLLRYIAPPSQCGYLPDQVWRLENEHFANLTPAEYMERVEQGWRRFGSVLFRPRCRSCTACQSLRVVVDQFHANRSQRRVRKINKGITRLQIGSPSVSRIKLELYDRYHVYQSKRKGWPAHLPKDAQGYESSFVDNPFPTEEWCYYVGEKLAGVGYVDDLPGGLSAIYFIYDPADRALSPGTLHVLSVLESARLRKVPFVYLGYYIAGCPSMAYKSRFAPNQLLGLDGKWHEFRA